MEPTAKRVRGRPPLLTAATIGAAVLAVGFGGLTFAAVADRLGVGQATLYRYAPNRAELARFGLDAAMRDAQWPAFDGDWRHLLDRWAEAAWRFWERHPGAAQEVSGGVIPQALLLLGDRIQSVLVAAGFEPRNAIIACDLVFDFVLDHRCAVERMDTPADPGPGPEGSEERPGPTPRTLLESQWSQAVGDAATAQLRAEMLKAIQAPPLEWFRIKLRVILAGIDRELAPCPTDDERATP